MYALRAKNNKAGMAPENVDVVRKSTISLLRKIYDFSVVAFKKRSFFLKFKAGDELKKGKKSKASKSFAFLRVHLCVRLRAPVVHYYKQK